MSSIRKKISSSLKSRIKNVLLNDCGFQLVKVLQDQRDDLRAFLEKTAPKSTNHKLIRLGAKNDGGYLVPDDLSGIRSCFSPGVSDVVDFEIDLARRNVKCYLADYSVASAPVQDESISFERKFLGAVDNSIYMTLTSWVSNNADDGDDNLILQMDIEGAEYDVLVETPLDVLRRFRILVIEFHRVDQLLNPLGFKLINGVFRKLRSLFEIVHIHPNNCVEPVVYKDFSIPPALEFTFLRKDRISSVTPATSFPHALDRPNLPLAFDFPLPGCWYGE